MRLLLTTLFLCLLQGCAALKYNFEIPDLVANKTEKSCYATTSLVMVETSDQSLECPKSEQVNETLSKLLKELKRPEDHIQGSRLIFTKHTIKCAGSDVTGCQTFDKNGTPVMLVTLQSYWPEVRHSIRHEAGHVILTRDGKSGDRYHGRTIFWKQVNRLRPRLRESFEEGRIDPWKS